MTHIQELRGEHSEKINKREAHFHLEGRVLQPRKDGTRLVVDCPFDDCNGAELYVPGKPFICFSCHHDEIVSDPEIQAASLRPHFGVVLRDKKIKLARKKNETFVVEKPE